MAGYAILVGIAGLKKNPPQGDINPLEGEIDSYRLRIGGYRILFIEKQDLFFVNEITPRGDAYKGGKKG
jgi:mRNA-degrading endonuclease RelE of RelBE toxin-antitoxin system